MEKKINKIFVFLFLLLFTFKISALELNSEKYILYNLNENKVLLEKDSHVQTDIASLTKIMTILLAVEHTDDYSKQVTITKEMLDGIAWDVAVVGFKKGEKVTYDDLLYGAMLESGADATNALAILVSGNKKDFVQKMNEKARELNLQNTSFANVVGLYDKNNYSSAYDMAELLKYALKNPKYKELFETKTYKLSTGKEIKSTLIHYSKQDTSLITGSKTGYIKAAGRCLASTATVDDVNYLLVTLNARANDKAIHIKDSLKVYNYYKDNYAYHDYVKEDDVVVTLDTKYAKEKEIDIYSQINKKYFHDNTFDKKNVSFEYDGVEEISYFTEKGTKLGNVKIKYNGEVIDNFDLVYNQELTFSLTNLLFSHKIEVVFISAIIAFLLRR